MLHLTLEGLTAIAADGSAKPFLAESVVPNATFDRWTIRVRPGIVFHNGEALDAEAVKSNLDLFSTNAVYKTDALTPIRSTTVVDERTVAVELGRPWPTFPLMLSGEPALGVGLMVAPATIKKSGVLYLVDPNKYADLFGTGPFIVDASRSTADTWVGHRNPRYWQPGLPYLDEVEIRAVPDALSRASMLDRGDLDVAIGLDQLGSALRADLNADHVVRPSLEPQKFAVALNLRRAPFDDPRMREAVVAATDVATIAATVGVDRAELSSGPYNARSPWFAPTQAHQAPDAARARELVAAYEKEHGPVSIRLDSFQLEGADVAVPQLLADQWKAVGIDVVVTTVDPITLNSNLLVKGDFDTVVDYFFGMPDPDANWIWWHSSALRSETKNTGTNFVGLSDPELDQALDTVRGSPNELDRRAANARVQDRLAHQSPYVWLWERRFDAYTVATVRGLDTATIAGGDTRVPIMGRRLNFEAAWLDR